MIREPDPSAEGDIVETRRRRRAGPGSRGLPGGHRSRPTGRPERLIAAHPAIAGQLRACLQVMNLADRMVDASSSASGCAARSLASIPRPWPRDKAC